MEHLPIYVGAPLASVESATAIESLNPHCTLCGLSGGKTPCMPGEAGDVGGVLVVGAGPTREDDALGRPFMSPAGKLARAVIAESGYKGNVSFDNATRCFGRDSISTGAINACRPYLTSTYQEIRPSRIIALGDHAIQSLVGRALNPLNVRKGYAWTNNGVPIFFVISPASARQNRFVRAWFEEDFKWALTATPPVPTSFRSVAHVVSTAEDAESACASLATAEWFSFDVETSGVMFDAGFRIVSFAACAKGSEDAWVWTESALNDAATGDPIKRLLRDPRSRKIGQNLKYDTLAIRSAYGIEVEGVYGDTRLWRKLMESDAAADLETMAELVGMGGHKEEAQEHLRASVKSLKSKKGSVACIDPAAEAAVRLGDDPLKYAYGLLPRDVLLRYNARDAVATTRLAELLEDRLIEMPNVHRVWKSLILRASVAVEQVEAWGIPIDLNALQALQRTLVGRMEESRKRLAAYGNFNPASTKQVGELLFVTLGLRATSVTDGGSPSTDRASLERLRGKHPIVGDLLEFRHLSKLNSTYAAGLQEHIRSDGRVHPNLKLDGAKSGRLSCSQPNLQNIPRAKDSEEGQMIRDCFAASPGKMFVELDYAQIELRVAAMLSGDPVMRQIFIDGDDYHLRTAQMVAKQAWGIDPEQVTDVQRSQAKVINFRTLYGGGDEGLAQLIGGTKKDAERIRLAIFGNFKVLAAWIKERVKESSRTGLTSTWWDGHPARVRSLYQIADHDEYKRSQAEHGSFNTPVQGTASEFCLASLAACVEWIKEDCVPARLVLPVHDSLMFEVDEDAVDEVAFQARRIMLSWPTAHDVPLEVDVKVGPSWGALKKYEQKNSALSTQLPNL